MNNTPESCAQPEKRPLRAAPPSDGLEPGTRQWKLAKYAEAGLAMIPLHPVYFDWPEPGVNLCGCDRIGCPSMGKHPCFGWKDVAAPHDYGQLEHWLFTTAAPFHFPNWAVVLGACTPELCGLDEDPRNGGDRTLAEMLRRHGPLPRTWRDRSSGGGGHNYFRRPSWLPNTSCVALGAGLEFLQNRHIVVIDPSIHKSGVQYQWLDAPWDTPLAELPEWLAEEVIAKCGAKRSGKGGAKAHTAGVAPPAVYYPPADIDRALVVERARKYVERMSPSIQGSGGSKALMAVCGKLASGFGLSPDEAWPILCEYNLLAQPPWSEDEIRRKLADAERGGDPKGRPRGYMLDGDGRGRTHHRLDTAGLPRMSRAEIDAWIAESGLTEVERRAGGNFSPPAAQEAAGGVDPDAAGCPSPEAGRGRDADGLTARGDGRIDPQPPQPPAAGPAEEGGR